jgi:superfamily II DNA or RNA helicase
MNFITRKYKMKYGLREYQQELKTEIRKSFTNGNNSIILCSPTGSGKTVTFADIARSTVLNGGRVLIAVDRSELLRQAESKLIEYGLNPSIITAGRSVKQGQSCYVATVQTLVRRKIPDIDLLIIDEAHKQTFDKLITDEFYKGKFIIGATATPKRSGKMNQLSDIYDKIVSSVNIPDLIELGFLTPAITYGAKIDTSKIKMKGQDFDNKELFNAFDKRTLYDGVVEKYKKFSPGTKAIVFNINVEHSLKVAEAFREAGLNVDHIDGTTPKVKRKFILEWFSKTPGAILCNCEILTTGYDEWSIETVIVNRATKSLPLWLQMCGRGSRIVPNERSAVKDYFNIIDMGGNTFEHGFWEQKREYSLKHKSKDEVGIAPVKECPEDKLDILEKNGCGALVPAPATKCKYCGYIFPEPKKEIPKDTEFIQLENYELLPAHLVGKQWGSMTIDELEQVRIAKKMKGQGWIIRQILMNKDLQLIDYAEYKGYKYPNSWVRKMESMYLKR